MLDETKNLGDTQKDTTSMPAPYEAGGFHLGSYTKTSKLISALYMVTDIMEQGEPLRNKLRTLGTDIVSDTYSLITSNYTKLRQLNTNTRESVELKIAEILSFLEISYSINLISEMNYNILKKEFIELEQSVVEYLKNSSANQPVTLAEFLLEDSKGHAGSSIIESFHKGHPLNFQGHAVARIGVQKGSTLMKALSDIKPGNSTTRSTLGAKNFDMLKKQRRNEIIVVIKKSSNGATITDIKTKAQGPLASLGEKTLQRELISMVKDNLLKKTGEKRWSRYFLPHTL